MIDQNLARAWVRAFAPPPKVAPSKFAEAEIFLPSSANAQPGPLRLASYQRELVDAIAADDCEIIVLMLSSQTGKSISIDAMLAYCIANEPGPMLHVSPVADDAGKFVRDRFDPLVAASPKLRSLVGKGQDTRKGKSGGIDSLGTKSFPGGQLNFASSWKPNELAAKAIRVLLLDEVDRFALSAGIEGDPIGLAIMRTATFEGSGRKIVIVSTPTSRNASRINSWYLRGDQRKFHVTCPDCGHFAPLSIDGLEADEGNEAHAHLVCVECGAVHDEIARRNMVASGRWVPTAKGEVGIRSYHLNALASKFSSLASVAKKRNEAKTPEQKQAFHNTMLAEVYDAGTEVELHPSDLQSRAEPIAPPYAADISFITAGVDVQGNRLECTFLAHHADETKSVLNHLTLQGDTTGPAVWERLDKALGTAFPLVGGRALGVARTAIDSGFNADQVLEFVNAQRKKSRAIFPTKGVSGFDRRAVRRGARLKGQTEVLLVGVDAVKRTVQHNLAKLEPGPGYIRLPDHLPPEYFEGLASEELKVRYVKGAPRYEYHRTYRRNEPFDCLVYASAIATGLKAGAPIAPAPKGPSFEERVAKFASRHNH